MISYMASGIWIVLVIPAVLAFIFGVWVFYNVLADVSERGFSPFEVVGPDTVRMKVGPNE
jgi:hypothetical protein